MIIFDIFVFIIGCLLGSFANVIILRMPQGISIVFPWSHCPKCKKRLKWYHNIPLLSWIFLRAKCAYCSASISVRYPIVELLMGVLFWMCWIHFQGSYFFFESIILVFGLLTASVIDLDHYILPDEFTLGGLVIGLLGAWLNPERDFLQALLGTLAGGGLFWGFSALYLYVRKQEGLGFGDVKLLAWLGAVLGLNSILFIIIVSSLLGAVIGIIVSIRSQKGLKAVIPYGPFLATAAIIYLFAGDYLVNAYIRLFFPT